MGQAKHKVIAVTLDRKLRLIVRPRSYRIQVVGEVERWKRNIRVGWTKGWVDYRKIPRTKDGDEFTIAVSAFNRQCVERNRK